jgi:hypothetical protein
VLVEDDEEDDDDSGGRGTEDDEVDDHASLMLGIRLAAAGSRVSVLCGMGGGGGPDRWRG